MISCANNNRGFEAGGMGRASLHLQRAASMRWSSPPGYRKPGVLSRLPMSLNNARSSSFSSTPLPMLRPRRWWRRGGGGGHTMFLSIVHWCHFHKQFLACKLLAPLPRGSPHHSTPPGACHEPKKPCSEDSSQIRTSALLPLPQHLQAQSTLHFSRSTVVVAENNASCVLTM